MYVDVANGVDSTALTNSTNSPFATLSAAVDASRRLINEPVSIILREGTHALDSTINLDSADSGLRIQNYPGEHAIVSGGKSLTTSWKASNACEGCFETDLSGQVETVTGLRKDDIREIRARYPNFDPERGSVIDGDMHIHDGKDGWIQSKTAWVAKGEDMNGIKGPWPPTEVAKTYIMGSSDWPGVDWPMCIETGGKCDPNTWTGEGDWGEYWMGTGGTSIDRDPPVGYWCAPKAPRKISTPNHPGGITATKEQLPNAPYKNAKGAMIHAWRPGTCRCVLIIAPVDVC